MMAIAVWAEPPAYSLTFADPFPNRPWGKYVRPLIYQQISPNAKGWCRGQLQRALRYNISERTLFTTIV
jgi:hypothetical protein